MSLASLMFHSSPTELSVASMIGPRVIQSYAMFPRIEIVHKAYSTWTRITGLYTLSVPSIYLLRHIVQAGARSI
jgi:hypothetical protein